MKLVPTDFVQIESDMGLIKEAELGLGYSFFMIKNQLAILQCGANQSKIMV